MGRESSSSPGLTPCFYVIFNDIWFFNTNKDVRKILDSKSLKNSQENIFMEYDLVKL